MFCSLKSLEMASSLLQRATQQAEALQEAAISADLDQDSTVEKRLVLVGKFCATCSSLSNCVPGEGGSNSKIAFKWGFGQPFLKPGPLLRWDVLLQG